MKKMISIVTAILTIASMAQAAQKITGFGVGSGSTMTDAGFDECPSSGVAYAEANARQNCVTKFGYSEEVCKAAPVVNMEFKTPLYTIDLMTCPVIVTMYFN